MEAGSQRPAGKKGRGKSEIYSSFVYRVLRQGHQERSVRLSQDSDLIMSIASEAARLSLYNKRRTITRRDVESAVKNIATSGRSTQPLPASAATE